MAAMMIGFPEARVLIVAEDEDDLWVEVDLTMTSHSARHVAHGPHPTRRVALIVKAASVRATTASVLEVRGWC
jgi:hypothetical protein